ncbi:MAG: hypothetical protein LBQ61_08545 [Spirochaetales bacterium]|jgi:hypothetical protein|nr:hypothetical protein [Spirochaetales bacterium]
MDEFREKWIKPGSKSGEKPGGSFFLPRRTLDEDMPGLAALEGEEFFVHFTGGRFCGLSGAGGRRLGPFFPRREAAFSCVLQGKKRVPHFRQAFASREQEAGEGGGTIRGLREILGFGPPGKEVSFVLDFSFYNNHPGLLVRGTAGLPASLPGPPPGRRPDRVSLLDLALLEWRRGVRDTPGAPLIMETRRGEFRETLELPWKELRATGFVLPLQGQGFSFRWRDHEALLIFDPRHPRPDLTLRTRREEERFCLRLSPGLGDSPGGEPGFAFLLWTGKCPPPGGPRSAAALPLFSPETLEPLWEIPPD